MVLTIHILSFKKYHKVGYISLRTKSYNFYHILENTSLLVQSHSPDGPTLILAQTIAHTFCPRGTELDHRQYVPSMQGHFSQMVRETSAHSSHSLHP